jgi:uncharacterized membrane protein
MIFTFSLSIGASFMVLVMTLLVALALNFFARPLSFSRALLISLIASLAGLGLPQVTVELPATLVILFVGGYLITKLAQKYGIKKTGWLGVGAKSMLAPA